MSATIETMEIAYKLGVALEKVRVDPVTKKRHMAPLPKFAEEMEMGLTQIKHDPAKKLLCRIEPNLGVVDTVGQIPIYKLSVSFPESYRDMTIISHSFMGRSFLITDTKKPGEKPKMTVFIGDTVPDHEIRKSSWLLLPVSGITSPDEYEVLRSIIEAGLSVKSDEDRFYIIVAVSEYGLSDGPLSIEEFLF